MERVSVLKFILAVLYFIIVELACYGHTYKGDYSQFEREALLDIKSGIKDPNNRLSSWKGANYCSWLGITCEIGTGFVISIDLHNPYPRKNFFKLSGEIRPSLGELKHLRYLDLSFNSFQAMPIPQFFGSLHNLLYLNLSSAGFGGEVPSNLGNLSNLQYLDLSTVDYLYMDLYYGYYIQLHIEDIEWLTSLLSLKYLSLDLVDLASVRSQWANVFKRLPNITELHLSHCYLGGPFPFGLGDELPNLRYLDLSESDILHGNISQLLLSKSWRKLEFLDLSGIRLNGSFPSTIGNFCNLKYLDLSLNYLNGSLPDWLGEAKNLRVLRLYYNHLEGPIPNSLWTLQHLEYLDLGKNLLNGPIPSSIGNLCNLISLDLSKNHLNESLPQSIEGHETCDSKSALPNLKELYLTDTQLKGKLPDWLGKLPHLEYLDLGENELTGSLPKSIGQLSRLKTLDVSYNHLSGTLSEQHFWNLSKLEYLYMASNSIHLNVSPNWIPPFQVYDLDMGLCPVGPSFPTWLQSQNNLQYLDFTNASISSPIPNWFWNFSFYVGEIHLSHNQIHGQLSNSLNFTNNKFSGPLPLYFLDLSSNQLTGTIPDSIGLLNSLETIDLSHNKFTGVIPDSIGHLASLQDIQFSRNNLTGSIPDSIGHLTFLGLIDFSMNNLIGSIPSILDNCSGLAIIDLGNNNLFGEIPKSLGKLWQLQSLHLNHNKLSGELPSSFQQNLTSLEVLDVSYNKLSSEVPAWIGFAFPKLVVLNLRSNMFCGRLPYQLSNLSSLQFLDIAHNNLMGEIPLTFGELKAMAQENMTLHELDQNFGTDSYEELLVLETKGQSLEYTTTLSLVVAIDLSNNNLSGRFPEGITKLSGLVALNLSRNHMTGQIPENISMLHQLTSLDLSCNQFSGTIPSSMVELTFLSYLNLSENKLSGEIPFTGQMTTFNELSFMGNHDLCGPPLVGKCRDEASSRRQPNIDDKNDGGYVDKWFHLSIDLGFAAGVLVPYFVLVIRKSWCEIYFDFVDGIVKWLLRGRRRG